jgi:hypothetical protein
MEIIYEVVIITMFITFMILYVISPKKFVVYKEPTVDTKVSEMYVDDTGVCYKYKRINIPCE